MNAPLPKLHVAAAVLTIAGGLGLTVMGWWIVGFEYRGDWGRFADPSWLTGGALRAAGLLAFGKVGFKVALACAAAGVVVFTKLHLRRRRPEAAPESSDE